jgi:predicted O-linked N-acetylglucosamine transferase (SPINDLY family)
MGNKKNKRGSIPSPSSPSLSSSSPSASVLASASGNPLRTEGNDYGVLSDPEENIELVDTNLVQKEPESPLCQEHSAASAADEDTHILVEPSLLSDSQQDSQPSSQPSLQATPPSIQEQISQPPTSKAMNALQLKLSRDKNFSKKITLHTFFSYIILAIEMQRSCCASISIAHISAQEVQELIEYMIQHHTETDEVRQYLQNLMTTGVIPNIIEAVIDFNKDQTEALDKLITAEEIEYSIKETDTATSISMTQTSPSQSSTPLTPGPTPQRGLFKRILSSLCCGGCR